MDKVETAIQAFGRGEIVVVTDDDDRENEGDLFVAASLCTPQSMAFIVRHTSGIVCAPLTRFEAKRLNLTPMVADNDAPHTTAFTISVDARHGTTTGISAEERTTTVRALANGNMGAADFVRPGHIFPLIAREGGVLMRSGHTEACVDLCKLAGLPPVGVISELVNDDGSVKRGEQVTAFAREHKLLQISVADLIAYRQQREKLVQRVGAQDILTPYGKAQAISYCLPWDAMQHVALVFGEIDHSQPVPVRFHIENVLDDVFGQEDGVLGKALTILAASPCGILVYLREGSVGVRSYPHLTRPSDHEDHAQALSRAGQWREIGLGAQILKDLNVNKIKLLASKKRHYVGLEGFGICIEMIEVL